MHRAKEKVIPIASSDDKRQVTAVLVATLTGEYLLPQVIYKEKTQQCHPKVPVPEGWDVWHSQNHWSNEETMKRYIEVIVPFIDHKREALKLEKTYPGSAIFDGFRGQTTPDIQSLLEKHCIIAVLVQANCTNKLQPMDVSSNKPLKDEMKRFQVWYADEVQKQLEDVSVDQVKVDLTAAVKLRTSVQTG